MTTAITWVNYSPERELTSASTDIDLVLPGDGAVTATNAIVTDGDGAGVIVEHVYVYLDLDHSSRGDLHIELVSPAGTRSVLVPGPRPAPSAGDSDHTPCGPTTDWCIYKDDNECDAPRWCSCDYNDCIGQDPPPYVGWPSVGYGPAAWNWKMATVRAWGESPVGTWRLEIRNKRNPMNPLPEEDAPQGLKSWFLYVYGHDMAGEPSLPPSPPPPSSPPSSPACADKGKKCDKNKCKRYSDKKKNKQCKKTCDVCACIEGTLKQCNSECTKTFKACKKACKTKKCKKECKKQKNNVCKEECKNNCN